VCCRPRSGYRYAVGPQSIPAVARGSHRGLREPRRRVCLPTPAISWTVFEGGRMYGTRLRSLRGRDALPAPFDARPLWPCWGSRPFSMYPIRSRSRWKGGGGGGGGGLAAGGFCAAGGVVPSARVTSCHRTGDHHSCGSARAISDKRMSNPLSFSLAALLIMVISVPSTTRRARSGGCWR